MLSLISRKEPFMLHHFSIIYSEASERKSYQLSSFCNIKTPLGVHNVITYKWYIFIVKSDILIPLALTSCESIFKITHFHLPITVLGHQESNLFMNYVLSMGLNSPL